MKQKGHTKKATENSTVSEQAKHLHNEIKTSIRTKKFNTFKRKSNGKVRARV
jgi:hypothetical protein